jgi:hypothetical protein
VSRARVLSADCRWKDIDFLVSTPKTWQEGTHGREAFCEHGVVDRSATMVTDGATGVGGGHAGIGGASS